MKKIFAFLMFAALLLPGRSDAQQSYYDFDKWGEVYFSFNSTNKNDINSLSQVISIDKIDKDIVYAYANERTFNAFLKYGYKPTVLPHPSTLEKVDMYTLSQYLAKEEYDWNSYPTYDAYVAMMDQYESDYPALCKTIHLANTVENRELILCKLTSSNNPTTKTRVLYTGTMHGDETTGYVMLLRLIDYLLSNYGSNDRITTMLDEMEIWICPLANPDGTFHGGNSSVNYSQRYNGNDVDLNRNYNDDVYGAHPDGEEYQPETVAFMNLEDTVQFTIGMNLHGGSEVCNYPWDNKAPLHADNAWWVYVCRAFADTAQAIHPGYMTEENDGITNGYQWYQITGSRQDEANAFHNLKEFTCEISNVKTLPASQLPNHWDWLYRSFLNFIEEGNYGIHGTVTDAANGQPLQCQVVIEDHDTNGSHAVTDQYGHYARPIKAGTYNVTYTAQGYQPVTIATTVSDKQKLVQNVQLTYTGITVDFTADNTDIAMGGTVHFTDQSFAQGTITSYQWQFPGGTPSTSNEANPTVLYAQEGTYDVTLTITTDSEQGTVTKENYITVSNHYLMQNGTFNTCSGVFYDDGGENGNYNNETHYVMTFTPTTQGAMMKATFESFNTESTFDEMKVYDGASTSAPLLGTFSGSSIPEYFVSTAADGSLTFEFESDYSVNMSGWKAILSCEGGNEPVLGDVNGDGEVSLPDLSATAAYILQLNPNPFIIENADVNGDGTINIADISSMVTIILQQK